MTIAYDAFSSNAIDTGDRNYTHTPVGTPRCILTWVFLGTNLIAADAVIGVTYGGVAMTEVTGSPIVKTSAEAMQVHLFELRSSIPAGAQSVAIDISGTDNWQSATISLTAGNDVEIIDTDATINSSSVANPSVTLSHGGRTCFDVIGFVSGQNATSGIAPLANWTSRLEDDFGGQTDGVYTYDIIGSSDVTAGFTQTAEDAVMIAIALSEAVGVAVQTRSYGFIIG